MHSHAKRIASSGRGGLDSSVGSGLAPWPRGRGFEPQPSTVRAPTENNNDDNSDNGYNDDDAAADDDDDHRNNHDNHDDDDDNKK
ncbi:hypothetical protein ElyMa_006712600 [Elysia marginata]|uniref:Uncharacterized protein n=1 Tax=Elysia marginata TaxID=1093978 RepID=A0AAV4ITK9_9GAST|nr:hypothetical protein ElyMa_006712600 [Elysia marginata]